LLVKQFIESGLYGYSGFYKAEKFYFITNIGRIQMAISDKLLSSIEKSSMIRKMFEEGNLLKQKYGADNVFDFSIGNPDVKPPKAFHQIIRDIIENNQTALHGYMPNAGHLEVRKKISQKIRKEHGTTVDESGVVMTVGAAGGLNVIFRTLLNPGDEVVVIKPYFVEYGAYIDNHLGKMILVDYIRKNITAKTKAILINSPNNPTGVIYSEKQIQDLSELLMSYQKQGQTIYLLADEPYREIVYDNQVVPPILSSYANSLVVTSYSKTLSIPGERIGYIAVSPDIADFKTVMEGLTLANRTLGFVNAPSLMQLVVAELLEESVNVDIYKKRRDLLLGGLKEAKIDYVYPDGAFYVFCKSPLENDVEFVNHLKKYNILAVPGSGFGVPGYFRLAYCISEKIIEKSLQFFKKAVQEL
jgi:aspartate aminotransferase